MYAEAYLIIAGLIAAALAVAFVFGYVIYWYASNWLHPTVRARAVVLRKRHKQWEVTIPPPETVVGAVLELRFILSARLLLRLVGVRDVPVLEDRKRYRARIAT